MTNMKNCLMRFIAAIAIAGGVLTGCQTKETAGPPILNGNWDSADGIYVAVFENGSFRAVSNDTGQDISRGEYIALAIDRVQLNWIGLVSGRQNSAECNKVEDNRLNCVDRNGNRFSLVRRIAS